MYGRSEEGQAGSRLVSSRRPLLAREMTAACAAMMMEIDAGFAKKMILARWRSTAQVPPLTGRRIAFGVR